MLGLDPGDADRALREQIGIVLQHSELPPNLTVREVHLHVRRLLRRGRATSTRSSSSSGSGRSRVHG